MKHLFTILLLSASIACSAQFNNPHDSIDGQRVYAFVQQMPKFNGDIIKYIDSAYKYPALGSAQYNGTIYATCIIDTLGRVTHVTVANPETKGKLNGFEKEAIRVISKMPRWQPGRQQGKAVLVRYDIPVRVSTE